MKTISHEVAKELAEAARDLRSRINETRGQNATDAVLRMDAALAKFDAEQAARSGTTHSDECWRWHHGCAIEKLERAEQGKAAEVSEPDSHRIALKLTSLLGHIDMAIQSVSVVKERIEQEIPSLAPAPAPSAVRAPAVVAAQGVTEEDVVTVRYDLSPARIEGKVRDKLIEMGWTPPETVAATRAQQRRG